MTRIAFEDDETALRVQRGRLDILDEEIPVDQPSW